MATQSMAAQSMAPQSIVSWQSPRAGKKRKPAQRHLLRLEVLEDRVVLSTAVGVRVVDQPATFFEDEAVNLSSTVMEPAGTPTYAWTLLKNDVCFATGDAATFSFTPDDQGIYAVSLSVADDENTVTDNSVSLKVVKQASVARASGPTTGSPGQSLTFTLTATAAAEDQAAGFTYGIDWDNEGIVD